MGLELIYTSARKGLKPGSLGFCTVAMSRQMSPSLGTVLESLSGYRHLFMAGHANYGQNPVNFCHYLVPDRGRLVRVIARISSAPADYTGRTNKLAHFIVLDTAELAAAGPAWLLQKPGLMLEGWSGESRWIDNSTPIPKGDSAPARCTVWERVTGDAGWAGDLLQRFCDQPEAPVHILCNPGTPMLDLFAEVLALLPPEARWRIAFSTYFTGLPVAGIKCHWRGVIAGNPATEGDLDRKSILDLTRPKPQAPDGPCHQAARGGTLIDISQLRISVVNREDSALAGSLPKVPIPKPGIAMIAEPEIFDLAPVPQPDQAATGYSPLSNLDESGNDQYPRRKRRWVLPTVLGSVALIIILVIGLLLAPKMLRSLAQLHQAMVIVSPPISAKKKELKLKTKHVTTRSTGSANLAVNTAPATTKNSVNTDHAHTTKHTPLVESTPNKTTGKAPSTRPIPSTNKESLSIHNLPTVFASPPAAGLETRDRPLSPISTQGATNLLVRFPPVPTDVGNFSLAGADAKIDVNGDGKLYNIKMQPGESIYVRWAKSGDSGAGLLLVGSKKYANLALIQMPESGRSIVIQQIGQRSETGLRYLRRMVIDFHLNHGQTDRLQFLTGPEAPDRLNPPKIVQLNNKSPSANHIGPQGGLPSGNLFPNIRLVKESLRPSNMKSYAFSEADKQSFLIRLKQSEKKETLKFWVTSDGFIHNNYRQLAEKLKSRENELEQQIEKEKRLLNSIKTEIEIDNKKHITKSKKTAILRLLQIRRARHKPNLARLRDEELNVATCLNRLKSLKSITFRVELYPGGPVLERFIFKGAGK